MPRTQRLEKTDPGVICRTYLMCIKSVQLGHPDILIYINFYKL